MTGNQVIFLVSLLFVAFACNVVNCRRTRSRGRVSHEEQREDVMLQDFQQSQMSSMDIWMPRPSVGQQTAPLEFSGIEQPLSPPQKLQKLEQAPWVVDAQSQSQWPLSFQTQVQEQLPIKTDDCRIAYDSVSSRHHHPMVIRPDNKGFLYPNMEGKVRIIVINSGKTVIASCPGPKNELQLVPRTKIYVTCRKGLLFHAKTMVSWSQLGCQRKPQPTIEQGSRACGSSSVRGKTHSIQWPIRRGIVINQISFCFDETLETVLFTHHKIHGSNIKAKIVESSRPSFKKGNMFSVSANTVYSKRQQKALFSRLLNSPKHLTGKKQHYLARGHLAPDSDFILEPEQDATYFYSNAVPQWQAVNNGNWKCLENSIRELADDRQGILEIWTGIHDTLHLPNGRNDPVELFLGFSVRRRVIPVPALLWKVVHDPVGRSAIAIVEVNDVRSRGTGSIQRDSLYEAPCQDLCATIAWVDWDVLDHTSGRTFCCSVVELRHTIPTLPDLGRVSILYS